MIITSRQREADKKESLFLDKNLKFLNWSYRMKTNINTNTNNPAVEEVTLNNTPASDAPEAENQNQNQTQEQTPEAIFKGWVLEVKKQLININFAEKEDGSFKIIISHKANPLLYPDIVIAAASMTQLLAFAANGLNAVLNDNSGSRKPEKWAEIDSYLRYGFLTKSDYLASLPKSKVAAAAHVHEWVDEIIILTINQTKELDAERKSKLISRLYSDDAAAKEAAFNIAKSWIEAVAPVKADYAARLTEWRQEQAKAAITPLLDAIDTL